MIKVSKLVMDEILLNDMGLTDYPDIILTDEVIVDLEKQTGKKIY